MPPEFNVSHGHWGFIFVNGIRIAEVTAIEYTIEIERVEVQVAGGRWTSHHAGQMTGTGELTLHKAYSDFESSFLPYVALTPAQLIAMRDSGQTIRPPVAVLVGLNDPEGEGYEAETLLNVQFWQYTGGFDITSLVGRTWPFTFEGISAPATTRIPRRGYQKLY